MIKIWKELLMGKQKETKVQSISGDFFMCMKCIEQPLQSSQFLASVHLVAFNNTSKYH